jgi:hypothetical protein
MNTMTNDHAPALRALREALDAHATGRLDKAEATLSR